MANPKLPVCWDVSVAGQTAVVYEHQTTRVRLFITYVLISIGRKIIKKKTVEGQRCEQMGNR